ncbi:MAG: Mandelate racemase [Bradyrhizobium sp.]|nr:Mandelate racemase [Bradyrhizobium sp.]
MGIGPRAAAIGIALLALQPGNAVGQIAVAVNDGKQARGAEIPGATPDTLSLIDIAEDEPRLLATMPVPNSLIGPPSSVAVARDERFAVITAAQALISGTPPTLAIADIVSVVDLSNHRAPRLVQRLHAGPGATGVAINRAGTLVLVASTGDDSISIFSVAHRRLTRVGRVQLGYQSRPTDVTFTPDGKSVLAVSQTPGLVTRYEVRGTRLVRSAMLFAPGSLPYGIVVSPDGRVAFNTNLAGRGTSDGAPSAPRASTITALDLVTGKVTTTIDAGSGAEHLALSPDGRFLAVTVGNGSNGRPGSPGYNEFGLLKIFAVSGPQLTFLTEARTGQWCQGAIWTRAGGAILLQCAGDRTIQLFRFNGSALVPDIAATLHFAARPASIATTWSR